MNLLPIGSIVKLRDNDNRMMIIGFHPENDKGEKRDYVAVVYPMGMMGIESMLFFNNSDIEEVVFQGYLNRQHETLLKLMEDLYEELENNNTKENL